MNPFRSRNADLYRFENKNRKNNIWRIFRYEAVELELWLQTSSKESFVMTDQEEKDICDTTNSDSSENMLVNMEAMDIEKQKEIWRRKQQEIRVSTEQETLGPL